MTIPDADYFARLYGDRDWRSYRAIVAKALECSEPGPMLDVGAGPGFLVEAATRYGLDCEGIDGSPAAIALAHERDPALRLRRHDLAQPLPFGGESFQTAFLNQVIGALGLGVLRRLLGEIHRVLRPGGMLFVASPNRLAPGAFADPTYVRLYTPTELARMLREAGFDGIVPLDTARPLLGSSPIAQGAMTALLRLTRWDRLSADSRCLAYRPRQAAAASTTASASTTVSSG
jgi:SAM-dependent methyltransferase